MSVSGADSSSRVNIVEKTGKKTAVVTRGSKALCNMISASGVLGCVKIMAMNAR